MRYYATVDYKEFEPVTYKGIQVFETTTDEHILFETISSGNYDLDVKSFMEKYKNKFVIYSSSFEHYEQDLIDEEEA